MINKVISLLLAFSVLSPSFLMADNSEKFYSLQEKKNQSSVDTPALSSEIKWKQDYTNAKSARTGFYVAGGLTGVAGIGLMVAGNIKASTAEDVDGCQRDGLFTVTCQNQSQVNEAQSRIDDGRKLIVTGVIIAAIGGGLLWGGSQQTKKIDDLEIEGRRKGYKLSLESTSKGMRVCVVKPF